MLFLVATTSLRVDCPNADRLERRTLVPIVTSNNKQDQDNNNINNSSLKKCKLNFY